LIKIDPNECTECKACMLKCSIVKEGEYNISKARIMVESDWPNTPNIRVCRQCKKKPCVESCFKEAIKEFDGYLKVFQEKCDLCGECILACPFGAIKKENGSLLLCDGCEGEHLCTEVCNTKAIKKEYK